MTTLASPITMLDRVHFAMMSFVHETLYGLFRDPVRALKAAGIEAGQRVLEVGCGPGFFTIPAARLLGDQGSLTALDVSPLAIDRVKEKIRYAGVTNVEVVLADAARSGLKSGSFDRIFVFGFEHHKTDMEFILPELWRLLNPAGILASEGSLWHENRYFQPIGESTRIHRFRKVFDDHRT